MVLRHGEMVDPWGYLGDIMVSTFNSTSVFFVAYYGPYYSYNCLTSTTP